MLNVILNASNMSFQVLGFNCDLIGDYCMGFREYVMCVFFNEIETLIDKSKYKFRTERKHTTLSSFA